MAGILGTTILLALLVMFLRRHRRSRPRKARRNRFASVLPMMHNPLYLGTQAVVEDFEAFPMGTVGHSLLRPAAAATPVRMRDKGK